MVLALAVAGASFVVAQEELPKFELPVVITSPGQAPEISIARLVFQRAGIEAGLDAFLAVQGLGANKTLVIILGASGKGLGEAGVSITDEVSRGRDLVAAAKERGIKLFGIHLGGMARMGDASMAVLQDIAKDMDLIVVREDADEAGFFTALKDAGVNVVFIEQSLELQGLLTQIFAQP